jgi:hypothetical protein
MSEPTFRDFAMAAMQGNVDTAAGTLETLLGLTAPDAKAATEHFRSRLGDPSFVPKAMGLRTAVTSGTDAQIDELLGECFGLSGEVRAAATAAVRARYPIPPPA